MSYFNQVDDEEMQSRSIGISTLRQHQLQQDLILELHLKFSLSLYQATFLVLEYECKNVNEAFEHLAALTNRNHSFRGTNIQICSACLKPQTGHVMEDDYEDSVQQYLDGEQGQELIQNMTKQSKASAILCQICFNQLFLKDMLIFNSTKHNICKLCFREYLENKILTGQVHSMQCPHCEIEITQDIIQQHTGARVFKKYNQFKKNIEIAANPNNAWCPNPACDQLIYFTGKKVEQCQTCSTSICTECKQKPHDGFTCQENLQSQLNDWQSNRDTQMCPKCKFLVEKSQGCNHMTCMYCLHEWCWICGSDYTSFHFALFNPLGCPALMPGWIRQKDWTLTKLILWRVICFILLLVLTPVLVLTFGPIICVSKLTSTSFFLNRCCCLQFLLVISFILLGILITPIIVILFTILLLPALVMIVVFYYKERQRLNLRHLQAMERHQQVV